MENLLINLGCGNTYHSDWVNIDFSPRQPDLLGYDLCREIPFPDETFMVVYHSHLLEHLPKKMALPFLKECFRVLRPGGVLRLAVPDMEGIARAYLKTLDDLERDEADAESRHAWMMVEMVDQLSRHISGGEMMAFWQQTSIPAQDFVLSRLGAEARLAIASAQATAPQSDSTERTALEIGTFRRSGECHLWMYDRFSLRQLLQGAGFEDIRSTAASVSAIPDFARYGLDVEPDGNTRKPDSLFMEARKSKTTGVSKPRVVHFCMLQTDGAGSAAVRLHDGLRTTGVQSFIYVASSVRHTPGIAVIPATQGQTLIRSPSGQELTHSQLHLFFNSNKELLAHFPLRPQHVGMFSESEAAVRISDIPGMELADIINLHRINGTVDVCRDTPFLKGLPIVWTIHDMNPFTGGCHYSDDCRSFERHCGSCPQLGSTNANDQSRRQWLRKMSAYRELDITVVCPSQWLAGEAKKSTLFRKAKVYVIPNGIPTDVFKPLHRVSIREHLGIRPNDFVMLLDVDVHREHRKIFVELIAALELLCVGNTATRSLLMTFGTHASSELATLSCRSIHLGMVNTESERALVYNAADCVLVPSIEDALLNVVLESMACGTLVVGVDNGGISDIVENGKTGMLVKTWDTQSIVRCISNIRDMLPSDRAVMRLHCREVILKKFTILAQSMAYKDLYDQLLQPILR